MNPNRISYNQRLTLTLFLALFLFTGQIMADNWNVGSGGKSSRNCLSEGHGPVARNLLWQNGINAVIAQQAVIEGNIVATSRIFNLNNVLDGTAIVAQDLATGDTLWTRMLPIDFPSTDWRSRVSSMKNGVIYATRSGNTNFSFMYALDALTGEIIWKSEGLVNESSTESCSFAENGDLVVGNFYSVIRVDATDGSTVWETNRSCPTSNGQEVSVYGNRGYYWEAGSAGPKVGVIDLTTGQHIFSSPSLSAGLVQQLCLFVGPDGTIYAPRSMNNGSTDYLVALKDNGTSFLELWRTPIGFIPFATCGVGPDSTIYTYTNEGKVVRLNPKDGTGLDTSMQIFTSLGVSPRMAIDADGHVFVTNGESSTGALYSFNSDLTLRWSENLPRVNVGGPAIGANGTLVVCGIGTNVRAYEGPYTSIREKKPMDNLTVFPNSVVDIVNIRLIPELQGTLDIQIFSATGNLVRSGSFEVKKAEEFLTRFSMGSFDPGIYFLKTTINGVTKGSNTIIRR